MRGLNLILILLTGGFLIYSTYNGQFQVSLLDALLWGVLIFIGSVVFVWTLIKDIMLFVSEKRILNFSLTFLNLFFLSIILIMEVQIQNTFEKPSLIKVFYDGDFNGTGIDFKKDGTYIFDNSAIGFSDYYYGTYKIVGNKITLDRDEIDNLTGLKFLEFRYKELSKGETELYLFHVDSLGNLVQKSSFEFRVVEDNRKNKLKL